MKVRVSLGSRRPYSSLSPSLPPSHSLSPSLPPSHSLGLAWVSQARRGHTRTRTRLMGLNHAASPRPDAASRGERRSTVTLHHKAKARLDAECSQLFGSWAGRYATRTGHTPSVARAFVCLSVHPCRPRPHARARALFRVCAHALHNRRVEHTVHTPPLAGGFPPLASSKPLAFTRRINPRTHPSLHRHTLAHSSSPPRLHPLSTPSLPSIHSSFIPHHVLSLC